MQAFLIDQAVIEMARALNRHPDLIDIPLQAILQIIGPPATSSKPRILHPHRDAEMP